MEVTIGVQNVARELTVETDSPTAEVTAAVEAALADGGVLRLTDTVAAPSSSRPASSAGSRSATPRRAGSASPSEPPSDIATLERDGEGAPGIAQILAGQRPP